MMAAAAVKKWPQTWQVLWSGSRRWPLRGAMHLGQRIRVPWRGTGSPHVVEFHEGAGHFEGAHVDVGGGLPGVAVPEGGLNDRQRLALASEGGAEVVPEVVQAHGRKVEAAAEAAEGEGEACG